MDNDTHEGRLSFPDPYGIMNDEDFTAAYAMRHRLKEAYIIMNDSDCVWIFPKQLYPMFSAVMGSPVVRADVDKIMVAVCG